MRQPVLVIMAAGIGSRYGGLKQIDPIGENGEIIIDYSIYDAIKAGFRKVIFIIKKDMEDAFREVIGNRIEKFIQVEYAYQNLENVPSGYSIPSGRIKPWGTGHAVLCCKNITDAPFAVINADDFYGYSSYCILYQYLYNIEETEVQSQFCMVGYALRNSLTEHGHVARGVCTVDENGFLQRIQERTKIQKFGENAKYTEDDNEWIPLRLDSTVSMNMWGFTPSVFAELEKEFVLFLGRKEKDDLKAEFFLPDVVDKMLTLKKAAVKVLPTNENWYGVTYYEDKKTVKEAIEAMIKSGIYPRNLWGEQQ